MLNVLQPTLPGLIGGSADLAPSNLTIMKVSKFRLCQIHFRVQNLLVSKHFTIVTNGFNPWSKDCSLTWKALEHVELLDDKQHWPQSLLFAALLLALIPQPHRCFVLPKGIW